MSAREPQTVGAVIRWVLADPWDALGRQWNYKSAVLSSSMRSLVFFTVNLTAGTDAAIAAMVMEFALRFATAGFYGALTQAFRRVEPARHGALAALALLPLVAHSLEYLVHASSGTPKLAASIGASLALTAVSTAFNLFAMRRGAFVVGSDSASLLADLCRLPRLVVSFIAAAR